MNLLKNANYKMLGGALALSMSIGLQGCTEQEVGIAVGAIAIGAGAIIIGDAISDGNSGGSGRSGRYVCSGGYTYRCTTYRDYYGRSYRECRDVWDSCKYRRWQSYAHAPLNNMMIQPMNGGAEGSQEAIDSAKWAETFAMSFDAAEHFTDMLSEARDGNHQALLELGFSRSDVKALAQKKMPSKQGQNLLAQNLNQSPADTQKMLKQLLEKGSEIHQKECRRARANPRLGSRVCR